MRRNREAISIWEYKRPGAQAITALENNVRAGARKRKCKASSSDVDIVRNQREGQRDPEWTRSNKDQMGVERNHLLLDCFEGEGGSHDSFTPGFMHLTH